MLFPVTVITSPGGLGSSLPFGQAGEVDGLPAPGLAVAEEEQVVQRLHGRRIGEAGRELFGRGRRGQVLGKVRHRHDVDPCLVHEAGRAGGGQRHRMDGVVERLQDRVRPGRDAEVRVRQLEGCSLSAPRVGAVIS